MAKTRTILKNKVNKEVLYYFPKYKYPCVQMDMNNSINAWGKTEETIALLKFLELSFLPSTYHCIRLIQQKTSTLVGSELILEE